jgi:hypothetical protein
MTRRHLRPAEIAQVLIALQPAPCADLSELASLIASALAEPMWSRSHPHGWDRYRALPVAQRLEREGLITYAERWRDIALSRAGRVRAFEARRDDVLAP